MNDFESRVKAILKREKPQIFRVEVYRSDHRDMWHASAIMRGSNVQYSAADVTVDGALDELERILDGVCCPHCGRVLE